MENIHTEPVIFQPQAQGNGGIITNAGCDAQKAPELIEGAAHLENTQDAHSADQQKQQGICLGILPGCPQKILETPRMPQA